MKKLAMVMVVLGASAMAAMGADTLMVKVPFDFIAGGQQFPAGAYSVSLDAPSHGSVMIQAAEGSSSAIVLTRSLSAGQTLDAPRVVFNVYGERRFLDRIMTADGNRRTLAPSWTEIQIGQGTNTAEISAVNITTVASAADATNAAHSGR